MNWQDLKTKLQGELSTEPTVLEKYHKDASIFEIAPEAVIYPKNQQDIEELVKYVAKAKPNQPRLSLTARAAGSDMTGGSINDSIIVDVTKHLNRISELTTDSVITEPGVMFRDLETSLTARGLTMPAYPVSKGWCAVGGMVGNNAGGEKTFKYGQVINYVQELQAVLADGRTYTFKALNEEELKRKLAQQDFEGRLYNAVYKLITENYRIIQDAKPTTSKNSAGYYLWHVYDGKTFDLTKLLVGSQGTLGIITGIKWRLVPLKRYSQLITFRLKDLKLLGQLALHVNELGPESFEIFDKYTFKLAMRYLPEIIARMQGSGIKLFLQFLPDWLRMWFGLLPEVVLLAEFTGDDPKIVKQQAEQAAKNIRQHFNLPVHLAKNPTDAQKYWTIRRESYNLLRLHNARKISAPFIEDIVVHPAQLPEFMPRLNAILNKYPDFTYTIAGHAGDANFHIIPLVDLSIDKHRRQVVEMSDEVFNLVKEYQGSITAEHNDGLVRGPFLQKMFGEKIFRLFEQTKQIFDPMNIFNPHKKTDADMGYYTSHIRRS